MDPIKKAFSKIKQEMNELKNEIFKLKTQISKTQTTPTHNQRVGPQQTDQQTRIQTTPTHNQGVKAPYDQNINSSIRNEGVPTDKQTNRPTNTYSTQNRLRTSQ